MDSKVFTVILVDDNLAIREGIKDSLDKIGRSLNVDIKLYSSDNGIEGLGYIFVLKPDLVIVDSTLPKYGGKEVIDYIFTNERLRTLSVPIVILDQKKTPSIRNPFVGQANYFVKSDRDFIHNLNKEISEQITRKYDPITTHSSHRSTNILTKVKKHIVRDMISVANITDILASIFYRSKFLSKVMVSIPWIGSLLLQSILYTFFRLTTKKVPEESVAQRSKDSILFRTRYYPTLVVLISSLLILIFQMFVFITSGVIIFGNRLDLAFALRGDIEQIDFNLANSSKYEYDAQLLEFTDQGIQLKARAVETMTEIVETSVESATSISSEGTISSTDTSSTNSESSASTETSSSLASSSDEPLPEMPIESDVLGISDASQEMLYTTQAPSVTTKEPVIYSTLDHIIEQSNINDTTSSQLSSKDPGTAGITYQLSPDSEKWYYYSETEELWSSTAQGHSSSNTIQELNQHLSEYVNNIGSGYIYIKVFLISVAGDSTPILNSLEIHREAALLTEVNTSEATETLENTSEDTVSETMLDLALWEPVIFNASYFEGNKVILGKVLPKNKQNKYIRYGGDASLLSTYAVNIYYTSSTNISTNASNAGEIIGSTKLYINQRGEIEFFLKAPSDPGGYVTCKLVLYDPNNSIVQESILSRPVENSTFTVDSTGDEADSGTGDGLCQTALGTCTLRAAIQQANATAGNDNVSFNISTSDTGYRDYDDPNTASSGDSLGGDDYWTIRPASSLPDIGSAVGTEGIYFDGNTQTVNVGDMNTSGPEIELSGASAGAMANDNGFTYTGKGILHFRTGTGTTIGVKNMVINSVVQGQGIYVNASNSNYTATFTGNYIGTDVKGAVAKPITKGNKGAWAGMGIFIYRTFTNASVTIGGPNASDRNVISGNEGRGISISTGDATVFTFTSMLIQNNYIGTDRTGASAIGNTGSGIQIGNGNNFTIRDNVISGSPTHGLDLYNCQEFTITSNVIGLNADQSVAIPNVTGIYSANQVNSTLLANLNFTDNVISGNTGAGIATTNGNLANITGVIQGNHIGTDSTDTKSFPNGGSGLNLGGYHFGAHTMAFTISENVVVNNLQHGIVMGMSHGAIIENNIVKNNTMDGVFANVTEVETNSKTWTQQVPKKNPGNGSESGAELIIRNNVIESNGQNGIRIYASSPYVFGNSIKNNTRYGIYVEPQSITHGVTGAVGRARALEPGSTVKDSDFYYSRPLLGGTDALSGSLCNDIEANCLDGNGYGGISVASTKVENDTTAISDNVFTNTVGNKFEQSWYGIYEVFSNSIRRTDISWSIPFVAPAGVLDKDTNTVLSTLTKNFYTCSVAADCPNQGVDYSDGKTALIALYSGTDLNQMRTWPRMLEYTVDASGNTTNYATHKIEQTHWASQEFSFDGKATTDPVVTAESRDITTGTITQAYQDRGEPWTDSISANGVDAGANPSGISGYKFVYSNFQIMEVEFVDANPIKQADGTYTITVDSTTNEDNVSLAYYDDGEGTASGGGSEGVDGLANGLTSLREAVLVAKALNKTTNIIFSDTITTFAPSQEIYLQSVNNSNVVTIDGDGLEFDGTGMPESSSCIEVVEAYGLSIKGFTFKNCKTHAIKITAGDRITMNDNIYSSTFSQATINIVGGTESVIGVTSNDLYDLDSGTNMLMNSPEIYRVEYLGANTYLLRGKVDNATEGPFYIEVCISADNTSKNGSCLQRIGDFVTRGYWYLTIELSGNGYEKKLFTAKATNALGATSEFSSIFDTSTDPRFAQSSFPPELIYPIGDIEAQSPRFDWNPSLDPDLLAYSIYLDGNMISTLDASTTSFQYSGTPLLGEHTWQIIPIRKNNDNGTSAEAAFNVITPSISKSITLFFPSNGITIDDEYPTFDWYASSDIEVDRYGVTIDDRSITSIPVEDGTELYSPIPLGEGEHTWQVIAYRDGIDGDGQEIEMESGRSEIGRFIVDFIYDLLVETNITISEGEIGWKLTGNVPPPNSYYIVELTNMFGQIGMSSNRLAVEESSYELDPLTLNKLYPGMPYTIRVSLYSPDEILLGRTDTTFIFAPDLALTPWLRYTTVGMTPGSFILVGIATDLVLCLLVVLSKYIPGLKRLVW